MTPFACGARGGRDVRPPAERLLALAGRIAAVGGAGEALLAALKIALAPLAQSVWPEVAWRSSRLTASGFPVEFALSSADDRLRATLEVAGPETAAVDRLDAGLVLIERLGCAVPPADSIETWRVAQAGASLRWGCWLGLRQAGQGFAAKLYVEVPPGAGAGVLGAQVAGARLKMIGHDPASGETEAYFALPALEAMEFTARLRALTPRSAPALLARLEEVAGLPLASAVRFARLGLSLAEPSGRVALFLPAGAVRAGAGAIRRRMGEGRGTLYRMFMAARRESDLPDHGLIALAPGADDVELRVGIAGDALW